jgi:cyanophycinase
LVVEPLSHARAPLRCAAVAVKKASGTLALIGGGEWTDGCDALDTALLEASGGTDVVVVPTAAAFEQPVTVVDRAVGWFEKLGATVRPVMVLNRRDADNDANVKAVKGAAFVYLPDGSPLHLRSAFKGSQLWDVIVAAYRSGGVLAASGAGATVVCDPMVDPRGGAYTVGLGLVGGLAVFPYHGTAADHLRDRSLDLLPKDAVLAGVDEHTALVRDPSGDWRALGPGSVTLYRVDRATEAVHDGPLTLDA